jgi:hypothetical protein
VAAGPQALSIKIAIARPAKTGWNFFMFLLLSGFGIGVIRSCRKSSTFFRPHLL